MSRTPRSRSSYPTDRLRLGSGVRTVSLSQPSATRLAFVPIWDRGTPRAAKTATPAPPCRSERAIAGGLWLDVIERPLQLRLDDLSRNGDELAGFEVVAIVATREGLSRRCPVPRRCPGSVAGHPRTPSSRGGSPKPKRGSGPPGAGSSSSFRSASQVAPSGTRTCHILPRGRRAIARRRTSTPPPALGRAEAASCKTIEQMRMANALCRSPGRSRAATATTSPS